MDCAIFYTNLHELFCQFISWTNSVNSGKFMDNCWISCQVKLWLILKKFTTISKLLTCTTAKKELRAYCPNVYTVVQAQYSKGLTANWSPCFWFLTSASITRIFLALSAFVCNKMSNKMVAPSQQNLCFHLNS